MKSKMFKWCSRTGYWLVLYSVIAYLINYLPVDFWTTVSGLITERESYTYYKVVATEGSETYVLAILIIGISLIVIGKVHAVKANT